LNNVPHNKIISAQNAYNSRFNLRIFHFLPLPLTNELWAFNVPKVPIAIGGIAKCTACHDLPGSTNNEHNVCYAIVFYFFSHFNFSRLIVYNPVYLRFRFVRSYVHCFFFVKILNKSNANIKVNTEKPFSKFVWANKFPIVFKEKTTMKIQSVKSINLLFTFLLFNESIHIKNRFKAIEILSKTYISSADLSLPPQAMPKGIIFTKIKKWKIITKDNNPTKSLIVFLLLIIIIVFFIIVKMDYQPESLILSSCFSIRSLVNCTFLLEYK